MSIVVVDSGILLANFLPGEPLHSHAKSIIAYWQRETIQLAAPTLFLYEVVAVLRKAVYQERMTSEQGKVLVDEILIFPIRYHQNSTLFRRSYELATEFNRPRAYDAHYLALAENLGCEFWTTDERLVHAVHERLGWVRWLNDFEAS